MKLALPILTVVAAGGLSIFLAARHAQSVRAEVTDPAQPTRPVVVELFTSEGCSSCPPADALLAKLDQERHLGNAEIIALEEHVDYWDQLGWHDPFSSSQWTERQQDYAASFQNNGVYTPQMVVDGRTEFVGSSQSQARIAIANAGRQSKADVTLLLQKATPSQIRAKIDVKMIPAPSPNDAQIWLAVTESGLHSNVQHGENAGEDLHHAAVVRSLRKVGNVKVSAEAAYSGEQDVLLESAWKLENLRFVVFVQDPKSRHILGAASVRLGQ
jgi:hypothetical protein